MTLIKLVILWLSTMREIRRNRQKISTKLGKVDREIY